MAHGLVVSAAALQCDLVLAGVDIEQRLPALDVIVVPDVHRQHLARHLRCHRHDEGLHPGLRAVRGQTVGSKIPEQAAKDQRQYNGRTDPGSLPRLRRDRINAEGWLVLLG